jgi:hypothetical protein
VIGLSRGSEVVVGLRCLKPRLLQEILPIEQAHRTRVLWDAPQAAVGEDLRPHPPWIGILQCRRRVRGEVKQVSLPNVKELMYWNSTWATSGAPCPDWIAVRSFW